MRRIKRRRVAGSLILFTGFVVAIAASILIKTSHVNYWEYYSIHVNSRMLYPLVTRATTVARERSVCVKCMRVTIYYKSGLIPRIRTTPA